MKPQVRPDQIPAELDDWQTQVANHLDTLYALAYPQPAAGDLDAPLIQHSSSSSPADRIDSPPRRLWRNLEDITERQQWWVHHFYAHIHQPEPDHLDTRWHVFRLVIGSHDTTTLNDHLWDELHQLLVDMRTVRYTAERILRSGPSPARLYGNTRIPKDQREYLARKLHERRLRGLSEWPTERATGIQ